MTTRDDFRGPALFADGFRPFFLSAVLFAMGVIPVWWLVWQGRVRPPGHLGPVDWHSHEMIFGYGAAVVAGFLFTAVPNWTGRLPTRGWPLLALLALWIAGRLAASGLTGLGALGVMLVDQVFLLAVAAMITREIVAGRNWRNLKVLVPVTLLWLANILFHLEAMTQGTADVGRRLGIALLVFLIMLIGGRIVPSFTRNWLARREGARLPVPFNRFDAVAMAAGAAAQVAWVLSPLSLTCGVLSVAAALLQVLRLRRWRGVDTWRAPILLMLHVAYLMVPVGFLGAGLGALGAAAPATGVHLFGIGAIGGMTVAVMARATLGHTGRNLVAGRLLSTAFLLLMFASVARVLSDHLAGHGVDGVGLSTALWTLAFGLLAWRLGPWLVAPRVARRKPSRAGR